MPKYWIGVALVGFLFVSSGCGGSDTDTSLTAGGLAFSEYSAMLPDGSEMVIEILDNEKGVWAGEFVVATETGPYAHQVGTFEGSVSGKTLFATCELVGGEEFTLSGTANDDKSMSLTRSDIPGTVLNFKLEGSKAIQSRADVSFNLNTGSSNGRATISTTPHSNYNNGEMVEYRGSWLGVPLTFWAYRSGYATLVTYVDPYCINTSSFSNYKLSDIPTATVVAAGGQVTMYSSVVRAQIKFKNIATVSP